MKCNINFDGGCTTRNKTKCMTLGVIIKNNSGRLVHSEAVNLGPGTTNMSEGYAALLSLIRAIQLGYKDINITGDSQLIVFQSTGKWKCKHENLIPIISKIKKIIAVKNINVEFNWQRRKFNAEADEQTHIARKLPVNKKMRTQLMK